MVDAVVSILQYTMWTKWNPKLSFLNQWFHLFSLHQSHWSLHWFAYLYLSFSRSVAFFFSPLLLTVIFSSGSGLFFSCWNKKTLQTNWKSNVYWRKGEIWVCVVCSCVTWLFIVLQELELGCNRQLSAVFSDLQPREDLTMDCFPPWSLF